MKTGGVRTPGTFDAKRPNRLRESLAVFRGCLIGLISILPHGRIAGFHVIARRRRAGAAAQATGLNAELFSSLRIEGSSRL
jgi:hypothetical protein